MKKKILISLVACFIAAGSFLGYNLTENTSRLDVSLADISVMAQADGESGGSGVEVTCYGRGVPGTLGYYYCNGSQCYWVPNADYDPQVGARKCIL